MYFKRHAFYSDTLREEEKFNQCKTELQEQILAIVV